MEKRLKGIILDQSTLGSIELPQELLELCDWKFRPVTKENETKNVVKDYDVVLTNKVKLGEPELYGSNVKYIGVLATGTNIIDLDYCSANGIEVKNAVGYSTDSVAQHTFTMLLSYLGSTKQNDSYVKKEYAQSEIFTHFGHEYSEIKGKKWGIIGLGNIGKRVAEIATVFGAKVVYYSTSGIDRSKIYQRETLDELLATCDIVSIHAPLNVKTNKLINASSLRKMKSKAVLLNLGRGGIVVEEDLLQALNKNQIAGACLDVFENEPFDYKSKYGMLKSPEKLLLSPHVAWASLEARQELMAITTKNLKSWKNKQTS